MKRVIYILSGVLLLISLSGCGAMFVSAPSVHSRIGTDTKPNILHKKSVGDTIINKYDYQEYEGIEILEDYRESLSPGTIVVKKGDFAVKHINYNTQKVNYCGNFYLNPIKNKFTLKICFSEKNNKLVSYFPIIQGREDLTYSLKKALPFKKALRVNKNKPSRKLELLYDGIDNGVLLLTYREYSNDFARPAFYRQLKYTLNSDNTPTIISYKSARIKVYKATNSNIEYEILSPLSL